MFKKLHKTKQSFYFCIFTLLSTSVLAENEKEGWYVSKSGFHMVQESNHGQLYAKIDLSKAGKVSVYFQLFDDSCKGKDLTIMTHDPIYIGGVLVKINHYCDGDSRYFMPVTDAGREHLINEFKFKKSVEVKMYDASKTFLFATKGFSEAFAKMSITSSAI